MRYQNGLMFLVCLALLLVACAAPRNLPDGPTPIPTLIPATVPANLPASTATQSHVLLSYPARPPSAALGQPLYQTHCASCHGIDGEGVVPGARNFNDLDYMRGETPADFYAAVTEGRGAMPSFQDTLSSDERWDVVLYTWRFSTDAETLALGKSIYDTNCAACHGEDGVGEVLGAADFTDLRFVDDFAPRDFYLSITQGKGSMPAWQGRLSQGERWAVINHLRSLSYDPTLPEESADITISLPTSTPVEHTCDPSYLSQTNPIAWDNDAALNSGKVIYEQSCDMCHGSDGSGALPNTPDLTSPQKSASLRDYSGENLCIIAEGQGAMPGWKETLSNEQMWQVLTYLASFGE